MLKLLADIGAACRSYHDVRVRDLHIGRIQCDEIWFFRGAKDKNIQPTSTATGAA